MKLRINIIKAYAWQAVAALLFVALATTGFKLFAEKMAHADTRADRDRISLAFANYISEQQSKNADAAKEARTKEQELQVAADTLRKDAYVQISRLQRERDAALDSLRIRPPRPATAANGTGLSAPAGPGPESKYCTGAELHLQDAEFLIGESAEFKELAIRYEELWTLYERALGQTEAVTGDK